MALFTCFCDKLIDLVGDGFEALAPEFGACEVDIRNSGDTFNGADGGCTEKLTVFRQEAFAFLEIFCIETAREQSAEGIREIIIA